MRNYQSVLILKPDLDEAQVDEASEKIGELIQKFGGKTHKVDKWGKKRLAYRVRKNKFGYYLNIYHSCDPAQLPDLEKSLQLYDLVIKYLIIRLTEKELERVMTKDAEEKAAAEAEASEAPAEEPKAE